MTTDDPILQRLCSPAALGQAFEPLLRKPGRWRPGVPMEQVRRHPSRHIIELWHDLHSGSYRAGEPAVFTVAKADGSTRALRVFDVRDRVVQRAALGLAQPLCEQQFLDCSYGYRPGLTTAMAYGRVREWVRQGYAWLVDADVENCFDNIPQGHALRLLQAVVPSPGLSALVAQWLPQSAAGDRTGLPQGMALSPLLCNLVMHRFDLAMRRLQVPLVRYADDFILLAKGRDGAEHAMAQAGQQLSLSGLQLHPAKTRVVRCSRRTSFLGQRLPRLGLARQWQCWSAGHAS